MREVPLPPELVTILKEHIQRLGSAADGRIFRTATGGDYTRSAYSRAWEKARAFALRPSVVKSPLAARPYDLRHGGVTLWLNAGVPAPEAPAELGTASTCCSRSTPVHRRRGGHGKPEDRRSARRVTVVAWTSWYR